MFERLECFWPQQLHVDCYIRRFSSFCFLPCAFLCQFPVQRGTTVCAVTESSGPGIPNVVEDGVSLLALLRLWI